MFYIILLLIPFLAWWRPEWGEHHPVLLKELCIAGIFFCNGVQLDFSLLGKLKDHLKPALAIQLGSVVLIPILAAALLLTVFPLLQVPDKYASGVLFTSMLPITTTSCVAFCRLAGVPIFDALINAILGNVLGMVILPLITPALMLKNIDPTFNALYETVFTLIILVILPMVSGILLKRVFPGFPALHNAGIWLLLYIIYVSYCKSFTITSSIQEAGMVPLFWGMLILHTSATYLAYVLGRIFHFGSDVRTTLLLTVPQKTVVLGIPLIDSLSRLSGSNEMWLQLLLPLLFYNNIQYLVGGTIAWVFSRKERDNSV